MRILSIELHDMRIANPNKEGDLPHLLGQFNLSIDGYGYDIGNSQTVLAEIEFDGRMPLQAAIDALSADAIQRLKFAADLDLAGWKTLLEEQLKPNQSFEPSSSSFVGGDD